MGGRRTQQSVHIGLERQRQAVGIGWRIRNLGSETIVVTRWNPDACEVAVWVPWGVERERAGPAAGSTGSPGPVRLAPARHGEEET